MKKIFKWILIALAGLMAIAIVMAMLESPEQKTAREAQNQEKAAIEKAEKAANDAIYAEEGKQLTAYIKKHIGTKGVGGDYTIEFKSIDKTGCNFSVLYEKGTLSEEQAEIVTCGFVIVAAQYYAANGRKPSSEGMRIIVRVYTPEKRATETRMVSPYGHAYYNSSSDQAVWKAGGNESMLKKMLK